jgi:hypothetical protein
MGCERAATSQATSFVGNMVTPSTVSLSAQIAWDPAASASSCLCYPFLSAESNNDMEQERKEIQKERRED